MSLEFEGGLAVQWTKRGLEILLPAGMRVILDRARVSNLARFLEDTKAEYSKPEVKKASGPIGAAEAALAVAASYRPKE